MTREEQLDWLCRLRSEIYVFMPKEWLIPMNSALDMAIKALEHEPCEDCISRQAVNVLVDELARAIFDERCYIPQRGRDTGTIMQNILDLPLVNPKPKTGHWIRWYEQKEDDWCIENIPHCKCSECGKEYDTHSIQFIKYCNECGAKMVEPQESEE